MPFQTKLRKGMPKNGTSQSTAVLEEFLYHVCMTSTSVLALSLHQPVTALAEGRGEVEHSAFLARRRRLL